MDKPTQLVTSADSVNFSALVKTPQKLVENAHIVAKEFNTIILSQKLYTTIQGKNHIHADGWSMLGVLLGVFPRVISTERIPSGTFNAALVEKKNSYGKIFKSWIDKTKAKKDEKIIEEKEKEEFKYKAIVAIVAVEGGTEITQITTMCSNREDGKIDNDEYAIESMAQTRGIGKAYRTAFGWIARMAGYASTPFEEMIGVVRDEYEDTELPNPKEKVARITPKQGSEIKKLWGEFIELETAIPKEQAEATKRSLLQKLYNVSSTTALTEAQAEDFIGKLIQKISELKNKVQPVETVEKPQPPTYEDEANQKVIPKEIKEQIEKYNTVKDLEALRSDLAYSYSDGAITSYVYEVSLSWVDSKIKQIQQKEDPNQTAIAA